MHLLIKGKLLDYGRITRDERLKMMVDYLGVDLEDSMSEFDKTKGAYARFEFLEKVYTYEILRAEEARGNDEQVGLHRAYAMRAYMLYYVGIAVFMGKSFSYT